VFCDHTWHTTPINLIGKLVVLGRQTAGFAGIAHLSILKSFYYPQSRSSPTSSIPRYYLPTPLTKHPGSRSNPLH
jgi:hypothetical protein